MYSGVYIYIYIGCRLSALALSVLVVVGATAVRRRDGARELSFISSKCRFQLVDLIPRRKKKRLTVRGLLQVLHA